MTLYEELKNNIRETNCDNLFIPEKLNELDSEGRKQIEFEIIMNIINGNSKFYKYIPYIECYDLDQDCFKYIDINKLSDKGILKLYSEICKKNKKEDIISDINTESLDINEIKKDLELLFNNNHFNKR